MALRDQTADQIESLPSLTIPTILNLVSSAVWSFSRQDGLDSCGPLIHRGRRHLEDTNMIALHKACYL